MVSLGRAVFWWETARFLYGSLSQEVKSPLPDQSTLSQVYYASNPLVIGGRMGEQSGSFNREPLSLLT